MIKIEKANKYAHCNSCGKVNEYIERHSFTPDESTIYNVKFSMDGTNCIHTFGFCKECLTKMKEEINKVLKE